MFDTPVLSCENEKEISEQLANFVVMCYNEAVEERGRFAIALSGGRAVTLLAQRLTQCCLPAPRESQAIEEEIDEKQSGQ